MKRALVISGGGSKGAFAVGALKALLQSAPGLAFDQFVGTSTGALIAPFAALGQINLLEQIYTTQSEGSIVKKLRIGDRLNTDSIFDANPLWEMINRHYTDTLYAQIAASGRKLYLNCTCLQTERLTVFTNDSALKTNRAYDIRILQNANHFRRAVMASACQPVFMPAIQVNRDLPASPEKTHQYVDGGVRQYAGVEMAIDAGAQEIFTILLSSGDEEIQTKQFTTLFDILQKTIAIFTADVGKNDLIIPQQYNEALVYIDAVKQKMLREGVAKATVDKYFKISGGENPYEEKVPIKIFTIRPNDPLGGGPGGLVFEPTEMKAMIRKGVDQASNFIAALKPVDVTWA